MRVAVIGAGISGVACADVLRAAGLEVELFDRGRAPGGRMASPELHGRRVDIGAAYFTFRDEGFTAVVDGWRTRGLARPWTSTLDVLGGEAPRTTGGTQRWAAPGGLRSLVRDLLGDGGGDIRRGELASLDELDHDAVVLAMPDPQAARLAPDAVDWVGYEPVIAVVAGFEARTWSLENAAFVNDEPSVSLIADDGSRRGDGAPVLVIHTGAVLARTHLDDASAAIEPAVDAARRLLGIDAAPLWTHAHLWTFAKPAGTHGAEAFGLVERRGRLLGLCGDSWCPEGSPRIEAAWLSGVRLGQELLARSGRP